MIYDIAIAGAGIAGLYTGWKCAAAGMKVCIIDRRKEIGLPVRCGEATGNRTELRRFMEIDESWIARDLTGLAVHLNESLSLKRAIADTGVLLHRHLFEQHLCRNALNAGVELRLEQTVTGLSRESQETNSLIVDNKEKVSARVIIGADGPESKIGRLAGITSVLRPAQAFPSLQYRIEAPDTTESMLHFFIGQEHIKNGYIWVFPKGPGLLSIGAGTFGIAPSGSTPAAALERFLNRYYPGAPRTHLISGCAPLAVCPSRLHAGTIAVVGDAARQVNPLTAGGIMNALEAADILSRELCANRDAPHKALERYSARWHGRPRREQKVFLLLQKVFLDCTDSQIESTLTALKGAFDGNIDRSVPFQFPLLRALPPLAGLIPRVWPHARILFS